MFFSFLDRRQVECRQRLRAEQKVWSLRACLRGLVDHWNRIRLFILNIINFLGLCYKILMKRMQNRFTMSTWYKLYQHSNFFRQTWFANNSVSALHCLTQKILISSQSENPFFRSMASNVAATKTLSTNASTNQTALHVKVDWLQVVISIIRFAI